MISTVTTTTTTTVTTATFGLAASLGMAVAFSLVAFLIVKELFTASDGPRLRLFGHHLNVGVVPLLMVFVMVVAMKVVEIVS